MNTLAKKKYEEKQAGIETKVEEEGEDEELMGDEEL
jgi:hypothetical protein